MCNYVSLLCGAPHPHLLFMFSPSFVCTRNVLPLQNIAPAGSDIVQLNLPCPWDILVPGSSSFHSNPSLKTPPLGAQPLLSIGQGHAVPVDCPGHLRSE